MTEDTPAILPPEKPTSDHFIKEYWQAALLLVLVSALAYLPMVTQLGFYHDDWFTTLSQVSGVSLMEMHDVDRPVMGMLYTLIHRLLGDAPLGWHLSAWAVRTAGGLAFLWLVSLLWPGRKTANLLMALFFVIYPGFLQTPSANNYLNHFIAYGAALLSLGLGIWAQGLRNGAKKYTAIIFGAVLAFTYPAVYEAMIGMEALRLILSWYDVQRRSHLKFLQSLKVVLLHNLPFLLGAGSFVVYRLLFFASNSYATDTDALMMAFSSDPYGTALRRLWNLLSGTVEVAFSAWFVPAYQLNLTSGMEERILAFICGAIAVGVGALWLVWVRSEGDEVAVEEHAGKHDATLIGFLGVILTLIPVILVNRSVQFSEYMDRYTLQSSAPAAIFLGSLIYNSFKAPARWVAAAFLLMFSFYTHIPNAAHYVRFWDIQKSLWWQVSWRAPGLAQNALLMPVLPDGYRLAEGFEAWGPLNLMYDPQPGPLYVTADVGTAENLMNVFDQRDRLTDFRKITYTRRYNQLLLLSMPTTESCVHFIDGTMPEVSALDDALVLEAAPFSRIEMVDVNGESKIPSQEIFGNEPEHGWCYYYQKASLARQMGDWEEVNRLGEEAEVKGLVPHDMVEWLPYLEAAMRLGEEGKMDRLVEILKGQPQFIAVYCNQPQSEEASLEDAGGVEMRITLCGARQ